MNRAIVTAGILLCAASVISGPVLANPAADNAVANPPIPTVNGDIANPPIPAVSVETPPVIDGGLDDACWADAPVVTGFTRDTKPVTLQTEVRAVYDGQAMYFAFTCHDPQPNTVRGQQRKRNGSMHGDDSVTVGIDPRFDKQTAYWFTVNALGTQAEEIPGGSSSKVEWRGDWRAAAKVTPDGWTAEMAVPFAILRYPRGQETFGLMFARSVPRLLEESNWPIRTFYYVHDNEARWQGVKAPRIRRQPLVMPYLLAGSGTIESNSGLDVKYNAENGATSLFTVRPDFATIEDAVQTIDFSYNPQALADRRPFFTEGGDFYGSRFGFYSRSIGDREGAIVPVDAGAKSFGKLGPWTYAGMGVQWAGETDSIGYLRYDPSPRFGAFGGFISQQNAPVPGLDGAPAGRLDNGVLHVGARAWKPLAVNGIGVGGEYYRTSTTGAGGEGHAMQVGIDRYGGDGVLEWHTGYAEVSPDYTARLAFVPERGFRSVGGYIGEGWQINRGRIANFNAGFDYDYTLRWDGGMWHRGVGPGIDIHFTNDTAVELGFDVRDRDAFRDRTVRSEFGWRRSDLYRGGAVNVRTGRVAGGPYTFGGLVQGARFSDKLSANVDVAMLRLRGTLEHWTTDRAILGALYEFSDERSLAVRVILGSEHHEWRGEATTAFTSERRTLRNAYAAFRQELRKGADIFVLAGDPNTEGIKTQVALKYVITF